VCLIYLLKNNILKDGLASFPAKRILIWGGNLIFLS